MAAVATAKDNCPTFTIVETDQKGKKKSRIERVWTEHLSEYKDKTATFTGPPMGYVGKCGKNSSELDFFMELFGDTADFIVSRTNAFMEERDDRAKRSKRNSKQPAALVQPFPATSSDPQPVHTDDVGHHSDSVHESCGGSSSSSSSSSDYEEDDIEEDDLDADRLSEASSGTEDQPPGTDQDETTVTSTGQPPPLPPSSQPSSPQPPCSPDVSWSRGSTSQSRKCLRVLLKVTVFHRIMCVCL